MTMILQKLTAVNKEQIIPIINVMEKPFIKLPPKPNNAIAAIIVVKPTDFVFLCATYIPPKKEDIAEKSIKDKFSKVEYQMNN